MPDGSPREDKIAAIGVRIRHWVSFHGISINVEPDLSHYAGIVPCGIADHGVTSLVDLGLPVTLADLDWRWPKRSTKCSGTTSGRRQPRKALGQDIEIDRLDVDRIDPGHLRAATAGSDHLTDGLAPRPTISASTEPSPRLRTQPARPSRLPVAIAQSR